MGTTTTDARTRLIASCVGYGLLSGTRSAVLFIDTLFPLRADRGADLFNYALQIAAFATALLVCLVFWRTRSTDDRFGAALGRSFAVQAIMLVTGVGAICASVLPLPFGPISAVAGAAMGIGFALGGLSWLYLLTRVGLKESATSLAAAWGCSIATLAVLALLPTAVRLVAIALAMLVSCAVGMRFSPGFMYGTHASAPQEDAALSPVERGTVQTTRPETSIATRPLYICLAMLALGFVFGISGPVLLSGAGVSSGDPQTFVSHVASITLAAALAALAIFAFPQQAGSQLAFQVALVLDATATVALPFAGAWYANTYNAFVEVVFRTSSFLMAYACVLTGRNESFCRTAPLLVSSGGAGLTVGVALGSALFANTPSDSMAIMLVTLAVLYLLFAALSTSTITAALKGQRPAADEHPASAPSPSHNSALDVIAARYGLSDREASVMEYLAKGRNTAFIAEHLGLSENTVKGYAKTLYKKLDVHSRQDLIDLVDEYL